MSFPTSCALSKGLTGGAVPLAVTMASEAIYQAHLSPDRARMFFHSSSYTANPIACAAANANLAIWRDEPVRDRIATLAARQARRLDALAAVPGFTNPRALGTIAAIDLENPEDAGYLSQRSPRCSPTSANAICCCAPSANTLYVMPPFCIDEADLDRLYISMTESAQIRP